MATAPKVSALTLGVLPRFKVRPVHRQVGGHRDAGGEQRNDEHGYGD
jgi:hypothetical protein